jgi:hypothetical protein
MIFHVPVMGLVEWHKERGFITLKLSNAGLSCFVGEDWIIAVRCTLCVSLGSGFLQILRRSAPYVLLAKAQSAVILVEQQA